MAFTHMDAIVSNIQALSNKPNTEDNLTPAQLKAKFDKAGEDIKSFINNTLIAELEETGSQPGDDAGAKNIGIFKISGITSTTIQGALEELTTLAQQSAAGVVGDGTITTAKLDDLAVTSAKLGQNAVQRGNILDGEVIEAKLASDSVTRNKIKDGEVLTAKLADAAVTTAKLGQNAVTEGKIEADAVTTSKILNGAVTAAKIAANTITYAEIANGAVRSAELATDAVESAKIKNGAVTTAKINDGAVTTGKLADNAVTGAKTNFSAGLTVSGALKPTGKIVLNSSSYGNSLPTAGTAGRIFFKKV